MKTSFSIKMDPDQYAALTAVPLEDMISTVQMYIYHAKHCVVKIIPPRNDKELQLLGKAYDHAQYFFAKNNIGFQPGI